MGKKYLVIEVEEPSPHYDVGDGAWLIYLFLWIPPVLSIYSMVALRNEGEHCKPVTAFVFSIVDMVIMLGVSIGLFFGVSFLSATIPFMLFLWSGANLAHGIIGNTDGIVADFIEDTRIDVALFLSFIFLFIGGAVDSGLRSGDIINESPIYSTWLFCAVCIIHIAAIFMFAYLNENYVGEDAPGFVQFIMTIFYLSPAIFYIFLAMLYYFNPSAAIPILSFLGKDVVIFSLLITFSAIFMILEGILLIVGHGQGCATFGILRGILNFVFAVASVGAIIVSYCSEKPMEIYVTKASEWQELTNAFLGYDRAIHIYLDNDLDLNGEKIYPISLKKDDSFDGQGHKILNGIIAGGHGYADRGFIGENNVLLRNLTLQNCIVYSQYSSVGAFAAYNSPTGVIENCHAIETYIYVSDDGKEHRTIYVSGIAGTSYGTIKNCTFENSDLNDAFPYSITCPGWAMFNEIAHNKINSWTVEGTIEGCFFVGTHGNGEVDFDSEG